MRSYCKESSHAQTTCDNNHEAPKMESKKQPGCFEKQQKRTPKATRGGHLAQMRTTHCPNNEFLSAAALVRGLLEAPHKYENRPQGMKKLDEKALERLLDARCLKSQF